VLIVTAFFLVLLGVLPSFAWAEFFTREDCHPEPRRLLILTFLSGVIITFFVLQGQVVLNDWLTNIGIQVYSMASFIALTGLEEISKFLAVFFVVRKQQSFDEPIDAMIYMIVAALGFAAVENIALVIRSVTEPGFVGGAIEIITLRFIGATLLHALSAGIVGYYWAKAKSLKINPALPIVWGIVIATILHAIFNYLIITLDSVAWPVLFLVVIAGFVFRDFEKFHDTKRL
jgi:protease PrsW